MSEEGGGERIEGGSLLFRWHEILGYSKTLLVDVPFQIVQIGTALLLVGGTILFVRYRAAMHRRAKAVQLKLARGLVYRIKQTKQKKKQLKQTNLEEVTTADEETYLLGHHDDNDDNENEDNDTDEETKVSRVVKVMELHPDFVNDAAAAGWQVCSLGHYLSSLRFFGGNTPTTTAGSSDGSARTILERELYVVLAAVLLQTLGPTMGAAVLPLLGSSKAESMLGQTAQHIVAYILAHILVDHTKDENWDPLEDLGTSESAS